VMREGARSRHFHAFMWLTPAMGELQADLW
jgi:hypothetical protein